VRVQTINFTTVVENIPAKVDPQPMVELNEMHMPMLDCLKDFIGIIHVEETRELDDLPPYNFLNSH
jgi:hypothetical protein